MHCDKTFKIHNTKNGELLKSVFWHSDMVSVVWTGGETLAIGSIDTTVSIWRAPTCPYDITEFGRFYRYSFFDHSAPITAVCCEE
jgi:WD40 repeat protein